MIGSTSRAQRAEGVIARMAARQGIGTVRLFPPLGTGGTYNPVTRTTTEVAYTPVGPLPAVLRDVTADEIKAGLGANWWLAGSALPTATATLAVQPDVNERWRIEVGGRVREIFKIQPHDAFLKVYYQ